MCLRRTARSLGVSGGGHADFSASRLVGHLTVMVLDTWELEDIRNYHTLGTLVLLFNSECLDCTRPSPLLMSIFPAYSDSYHTVSFIYLHMCKVCALYAEDEPSSSLSAKYALTFE